MFKTIINAFKVKEVRRKIILTILLLVIYRLGCWLPIPGIAKDVFVDATTSDKNGFLGLLSTLSGGALENASILALGVSPYINASIVIQLLQYAFPKFGEFVKNGGEDAKIKVNFYTRVLALVLAIAHAIAITSSFNSSNLFETRLWGDVPGFVASLFVIVIFVAGAMFTVWIGERITQIGIGNGLSLLIFVGILSSAGGAILSAITTVATSGISYIWNILLFLLVVVLVFAFIVFIDGSERKIPVQYAKQVRGRKTYGGQSNFIPVKINANGVMPIILASTLLSFPYMIISIFNSADSAVAEGYNKVMGTSTPLYIFLTIFLVFFFSYFWTQLTFNPEDISKNIQRGGGFINGIRPGKDTGAYLGRVSKRITFFGAVFLAFIALVPTLVFNFVGGNLTGLGGAFGATSLMIVVSVAIELQKQLDSQLVTRNYKGFLSE